MKILYAVQGTGNGHIARAQEVLPILEKYASVDLLISGHQSQLKLNREPDYSFDGISLLYNNKGGLSYWKTALKNNYIKALKNMKSLNLDAYDLVINDFEPISAWACKLKNKPCIALSHQASLTYKEVPKPKKKNWLGELILHHYSPSKNKLGFHFKAYNPEIQAPVIREKIRALKPKDDGFYLVYLPSFSNKVLLEKLSKVPTQWKVFSKNSTEKSTQGNVTFYPISEGEFLNAFESCSGILCSAGFETPSEALYLNKKLFVIPIKNQYEQYCNACSLHEMGVPNSTYLSIKKLNNWVFTNNRLHIKYDNNLEDIIRTKVLKLS